MTLRRGGPLTPPRDPGRGEPLGKSCSDSRRSEGPCCCGGGCDASGQQGGVGCGRPSFSSWAACSRPRAFPVSPSSLRGGRSPHPRIDFPCEVSLPALRHPLPVRPWTAPSRASCPLSPSFLPRTPELPGLGWPRPRGAGRGRCCGHLACWDLACCPCPAAWVGVLVPLHCTPSGIHLLTPCHLCHGVGSSLPATQQWGQGRTGLRETPARAQGLPGLAGHLQDSWAWGAGGDARPGPGFPPGASLQVPSVSEGGDSSPDLKVCGGVERGPGPSHASPGPPARAPGVQPRPKPRASWPPCPVPFATPCASRSLGPAPSSDGRSKALAALASGFWSRNSCSDS